MPLGSVMITTLAPCFISSCISLLPPSWPCGKTSIFTRPWLRALTRSAKRRQASWAGSVGDSTCAMRRLVVDCAPARPWMAMPVAAAAPMK